MWLKRWGQSPEEIARKIQTTGLLRSARIISGALGESPPLARELPAWLEEVLAASMDRMCRYDQELMPAPSQCGALEASREFLYGMPPSLQEEFQSLLVLIEVSPYVFGPRRMRFTSLSGRDQDVLLQGWERSSLMPRQAGFSAIKSLVMMGYWTRPEAFASIGYSVANNPGVPQPQRGQWQKREGGPS